MSGEIALRDIEGRPVRVFVADALAAIGDTLLEGESLFAPRSDQTYVKCSLATDSEVPG